MRVRLYREYHLTVLLVNDSLFSHEHLLQSFRHLLSLHFLREFLRSGAFRGNGRSISVLVVLYELVLSIYNYYFNLQTLFYYILSINLFLLFEIPNFVYSYNNIIFQTRYKLKITLVQFEHNTS